MRPIPIRRLESPTPAQLLRHPAARLAFRTHGASRSLALVLASAALRAALLFVLFVTLSRGVSTAQLMYGNF